MGQQPEFASPHNKEIGAFGEELAAHYLELHGFDIVERNCRTLVGEIDILAREGEELVFCEVKTRENLDFGPPECAVTAHKLRQMRRVARCYLAERRIEEQVCRFDVVAVLLTKGQPEITHFKNVLIL
jgi:putative endonuclease